MTNTPAFSTSCVRGELAPCACGANAWVYVRDRDNGDWCEEQYRCNECGKGVYVELPD